MTRPLDKPLAPRDLLVLVVLADGPSHGYGLIKAVEKRSASGVQLDPANLYRLLRRMRRAQWIFETEEKGPDAAGDAGPPRRTYDITELGRQVLEAEVSRLESLLHQARPALADREQ